jgi:hypothetical protein
MPTQKLWSDRHPDYGVPYKVIQRNSWAETILSYAAFTVRVRPPGYFTHDSYCEFRMGNLPRKESFQSAIKKLVGLGYLIETSPGSYQITSKGLDANLRISRRNAKARNRIADED